MRRRWACVAVGPAPEAQAARARAVKVKARARAGFMAVGDPMVAPGDLQHPGHDPDLEARFEGLHKPVVADGISSVGADIGRRQAPGAIPGLQAQGPVQLAVLAGQTALLAPEAS